MAANLLRAARASAWALLAAFGLFGGTARAESAVDPATLHKDIREAVLRVPVTVQDAYGRDVAGNLLVTTFKPNGPGPFPLLIISHGRSSDKRSEYGRQRFESAARFFVRKGFAVAAPLRLGYGELAALGDPESSQSCDKALYGPALIAAAQQIIAVAQAMAAQPDIDGSRLVLVGQSVGGIATVAAAASRPAGLMAAINFAGGHGGSPTEHRGEPCQSMKLKRLFKHYGELNANANANATADAPTPTLWIYTENDMYFAPHHSRAWAEAYRSGGGLVDYRLLPAIGDDGHRLFAAANDVWQPLVDEFLTQQGFTQPGIMKAPPSTDFAPLTDVEALPLSSFAAQESYKKFLLAKPPRAFALNSDGEFGYASGEDVLSRALGFCQRRKGKPCSFYAVDDKVVWRPQ
ncbi:prolyl oligopeptidase family serine peptidase [Paucibacter sp. B2R-40]|uniref:alpha/beta hydrolase family protein n=1 Tax=Paucibacter sp. B2R-40 TaxID=2893554 RepID=UPI0021E4BD58|nr:prolyl oligopeptidase family serine peptidase [Paucibacter sp. B2R-40]MCV2356988.1 prolyl oligopeptidase family serine peptidase [Paucibacter sp. B2R-40]